ncbi:MAG: hypothetical protein HY053_05115 [Proteobacteria bacterium]|nr:hypothetical protein [Pseudomonadota bacterium]
MKIGISNRAGTDNFNNGHGQRSFSSGLFGLVSHKTANTRACNGTGKDVCFSHEFSLRELIDAAWPVPVIE